MTATAARAPQTLSRFAGDPSESMSLLQAVSWMSTGTADPHPTCCCPVLARFGDRWSSDLRNDTERAQMIPYIERLIGSRRNRAVERRRVAMTKRWLTGVYTPVWLNLAGLPEHAEALQTMRAVAPTVLRDAYRAIGHRRCDDDLGLFDAAVSQAVGASAGQAAVMTDHRHAGYMLVAYRVACTAARMSADDATWRSSPGTDWAELRRAVTRDALEPTVQHLQQSAHELFDEMININDVTP